MQGMHYQYLTDLARRTYGAQPQTGLADLEMRYRYNQDFKQSGIDGSGGDSRCYWSSFGSRGGPRRGEGERARLHHESVCDAGHAWSSCWKQLPLLLSSMISFFGLVALAVVAFRVPLRGAALPSDVGRSCVCDRRRESACPDVCVHP